MKPKKAKTIFVCSECGEESIVWGGQCMACKAWNSLTEMEKAPNSKRERVSSNRLNSITPMTSISSGTHSETQRIATGMPEMDRLLGGGIASGSVVLLGGEPGIGKSTLLLKFADSGKKILYVTAEENAGQVQNRAVRTNTLGENVSILEEYSIESILEKARAFAPEILIVDSVQAITVESEKAFPGSPSQIRLAAAEFIQFARDTGAAVWLTGHITKDGQIAGPKLLEHMVDVVLYFENQKFGQYRFIRAVKNRYGSTGEIAIFEMTSAGLEEVPREKSLIHLEDTGGVGSILFPQVDGTRSMPVEIQVLVSPSTFSAGRRVGENIDVARIQMIAAILEKFLKFPMGSTDIFVKVFGGTYMRDSGGDLALLVAMASSFLNVDLPVRWAAAGEVSLTGKIRPPSQVKDRRKTLVSHEIKKMIWGGKQPPESTELNSSIKEFYFSDIKECIEMLFAKSLSKQ